MHRWRNQLTVAVVAFFLGLLVVGQLRAQQGGAGMAGLSAQDLTVLIANLNARNDQLRQETRMLERDVATLAGNQARGQTSVDQIRLDLSRVRAWAGLEPVVGPGVAITVSGELAGHAVEEIINELRNAGAEAIAIGSIRVVPGVVVVGAPGELVVDGVALDTPFEIRAIGSPEALTGSLTRIGGVIAQLAAQYPEAVLTVTPVERLELPATSRTMVPGHARPRL